MKKVLTSLALSVLCLAVTVGSFLANDVAAYKDWAMQNTPRVMEKFERRFGGAEKNLPPPPPAPAMAPRDGAPGGAPHAKNEDGWKDGGRRDKDNGHRDDKKEDRHHDKE